MTYSWTSFGTPEINRTPLARARTGSERTWVSSLLSLRGVSDGCRREVARRRELPFLPSKLSQVIPQDVDAQDHHGSTDDLPEELVGDDQRRHHGESYGRACHQVGQPAAESRLDQQEQGDGAGQGKRQEMPSFVPPHQEEDYEHHSHAGSGP